jgi:hypothetical protein
VNPITPLGRAGRIGTPPPEPEPAAAPPPPADLVASLEAIIAETEAEDVDGVRGPELQLLHDLVAEARAADPAEAAVSALRDRWDGIEALTSRLRATGKASLAVSVGELIRRTSGPVPTPSPAARDAGRIA